MAHPHCGPSQPESARLSPNPAGLGPRTGELAGMSPFRRTALLLALSGLLAGPLVVAADAAPAGLARPHAAGAAGTEPGHGSALCDDLDSSMCLLPYPNDWWTRPDTSTVTGRRVDFPLAAMPRNVAGVPTDTSEYNRMDGFSPGSTLITHVAGLDTQAALAANDLVNVSDMGAYDEPDQRVVVIDASTGERWPVWAEVDANGGTPEKSNLLIHPAVNFTENTRYIVALRNLAGVNGQRLLAPAAFRAYRDGTAATSDPRRAHMNEIFAELGAAGIQRHSLYLAWDFTVASAKSLTGRLLSMRNRSFADLGDTNLRDMSIVGRSPKFHVTKVTKYTEAEDSRIARQVVVDVTVPCFIFPSCSVPNEAAVTAPSPIGDELPLDSVPANAGTGHFILNGSGPYAVPRENPQPLEARVVCNIPRQALQANNPVQVRPSLYGHGLFGSGGEVNAGNVKDMSSRHAVMFCAPNWVGMATGDVPNALVSLVDMSEFPLLADRMQQGILDFLVVGRAMVHRNGFGSDPAFQWHGRSVIEGHRLYYDGNSQGGIYGGTVCAVIPDANRCVIGVTGMAYSMLLYRSSDFVADGGPVEKVSGGDLPAYATPFETAYQDPAERQVILALIQMLWDRSDPNGYAAHMTDHPLPGTPQHRVLMQVAFGDHQVANVTADAEARTIGAGIVWPALESPDRNPDVVDYWALPRLTAFPYAGSAMTVFDIGPVRTVDGNESGVNAPPRTNTANSGGRDPHGGPRATLCGQQQKSDFLQPNGVVTAPCGGGPYFAMGYHDALN